MCVKSTGSQFESVGRHFGPIVYWLVSVVLSHQDGVQFPVGLRNSMSSALGRHPTFKSRVVVG